MTYMSRASKRYAKPRPRPPLSGFLEDILEGLRGQSQQSACIDTANQAVAPFEAKITDLIQNWDPTGFYEPQDIRSLVSSTLAVVQQGQNAINTASAEPNASQETVMRVTSDLGRAGQRSLAYLEAANNADSTGIRVINAPGLKRWVTDTLATAADAMVAASVIGCIRPWWIGALSSFQSAFETAWAGARSILGAALAIGETVLKVAGDLPEIYDLLKVAGGALGAYWVYIQLFEPAHPWRLIP